MLYRLTHDLSLDEISSYIEVDDEVDSSFLNKREYQSQIDNRIENDDVENYEKSQQDILNQNESKEGLGNNIITDICEYEIDNRLVERNNQKNGLQVSVLYVF